MIKQIVPAFIGDFKEALVQRMFDILDEDKNG